MSTTKVLNYISTGMKISNKNSRTELRYYKDKIYITIFLFIVFSSNYFDEKNPYDIYRNDIIWCLCFIRIYANRVNELLIGCYDYINTNFRLL